MKCTMKKRFLVFCLVAALLIPDFIPGTGKTATAANYNIVNVGDYLAPGDVFSNMVYVDDHAPECMFVFPATVGALTGKNNASPVATGTAGVYAYTLPDYGTACAAGFLPDAAGNTDKVFVCWKVTGANVADGIALNAVVLQAVMADRYTISYEWAGAVPPAIYPTSYLKSEIGVVAESLPVPTKTGYTFEGWYTDDELAEGSKITSVSGGQTGELTLYPKFIPNNYTITYKLDGGTNGAGNPHSYTYGTGVPSLAAASKTGYTFEGWYTDAGFTEGNRVTFVSETQIGNVTLYAKFIESSTATTEPSATPEPSVTPTPPITTEPSTTLVPSATSEPSVTPTPPITPEPSATTSPSVIPKPSATPTPSGTTPTLTPTPSETTPTPSGTTTVFEKIYIDDTGKGRYKIRNNGDGTKRAIYVGPTDKNAKSVTIPGRAAFKGVRHKVTAIERNALKDCKRLKRVRIGKNVKKIGKKAFYGRKSLKKLNIQTKKLTAKKVGKKAFGKTYKKMKVIVPKKKLKAYKKLLRKRGISRKAKFTC